MRWKYQMRSSVPSLPYSSASTGFPMRSVAAAVCSTNHMSKNFRLHSSSQLSSQWSTHT